VKTSPKSYLPQGALARSRWLQISEGVVKNSEICRIFATGKRHLPGAEFEQAESSGQGRLSSGISKSVRAAWGYLGGRYAAELDR
jgi:hypothetical protein